MDLKVIYLDGKEDDWQHISHLKEEERWLSFQDCAGRSVKVAINQILTYRISYQ